MFPQWKRRWKRRLLYFLERGWRYALMSPLMLLVRLTLYRESKVSVEGIRLISMEKNKEQAEIFERVTTDALKLIRLRDPRRFRRIRRHVRCIINDTQDSGGAWSQDLRCCQVDFSRYQVSRSQEYYSWYLAQYAATLVHEATHAHVYSRHIAYNKHTRVRIERLCRLEQQRFARRFPCDQYDYTHLVPAFNEADWSPYWNVTFAENARAKWKRVKEIMRSKPPAKP